ncbi:ATP-binding protein [Rhodococcus sp. ACT016]|uniref:ATP-binding protein n=1 Tax=Rhodococcus sp. ACT016 TaxID=3134808 RepID=UPI003D26DDA6
MSQTYASPSRSENLGPVIELRTPAEASQLAPIRGVSAALAGQCNMNLDQIADLQLAVDEACSALFRIAIRETEIVCRFRLSADTFQFSAGVATARSDVDWPYERRFGWHVLRTLTDELELHRHHGNGDGSSSTVVISFTLHGGDMT